MKTRQLIAGIQAVRASGQLQEAVRQLEVAERERLSSLDQFYCANTWIDFGQFERAAAILSAQSAVITNNQRLHKAYRRTEFRLVSLPETPAGIRVDAMHRLKNFYFHEGGLSRFIDFLCNQLNDLSEPKRGLCLSLGKECLDQFVESGATKTADFLACAVAWRKLEGTEQKARTSMGLAESVATSVADFAACVHAWKSTFRDEAAGEAFALQALEGAKTPTRCLEIADCLGENASNAAFAVRCISRAETLAKTTAEWIDCASRWTDSLGALQDKRRCLMQAALCAHEVHEFGQCARAWIEMVGDKDNASQCISNAQSLARSADDWRRCAELWRRELNCLESARQCFHNAADVLRGKLIGEQTDNSDEDVRDMIEVAFRSSELEDLKSRHPRGRETGDSPRLIWDVLAEGSRVYFYPGCGPLDIGEGWMTFDFDPLLRFSHLCQSFVFCDYAPLSRHVVNPLDFLELARCGDKGLTCLECIPLNHEDVIPLANSEGIPGMDFPAVGEEQGSLECAKEWPLGWYMPMVRKVGEQETYLHVFYFRIEGATLYRNLFAKQDIAPFVVSFRNLDGFGADWGDWHAPLGRCIEAAAAKPAIIQAELVNWPWDRLWQKHSGRPSSFVCPDKPPHVPVTRNLYPVPSAVWIEITREKPPCNFHVIARDAEGERLIDKLSGLPDEREIHVVIEGFEDEGYSLQAWRLDRKYQTTLTIHVENDGDLVSFGPYVDRLVQA